MVAGEGTYMASSASGHPSDSVGRGRHSAHDRHQRGEHYVAHSVHRAAARSASVEPPSTLAITCRIAVSAIALYFGLVGLTTLVLRCIG
jgi:hypothetical protein